MTKFTEYAADKEEATGVAINVEVMDASQSQLTQNEQMKSLIREHKIDFVMDAAPPFARNYIFDAAYEAGANYAIMGTWSVPMEEPAYGLGIENSYTEPMTKYNFDRHEQWKEKGKEKKY